MRIRKSMRMYFFVARQLSGLDKGIQCGHAALQYSRCCELGIFDLDTKKQYDEFADFHKTFIILNGGALSELVDRETELEELNIDFASFVEPDLNDSVSAIAFIVDETIYNFDETKLSQNGLMYFPEQFLSEEDQRKYKIYKYLKSFRLASN
jgi:hypothetical protein